MARKYYHLGKIRAEQLVQELTDIMDTSTMRHASFSLSNDENEDKRIKEVTRLWRETWITAPLNEIIHELRTIYNI